MRHHRLLEFTACLLVAMLLCSSGQAETYTATRMKIQPEWKVEFKGGAELSFKQDPSGIRLRWKPGSGSMRLPGALIRAAGGLGALSTEVFERWSKSEHQREQKIWTKAKKRHESSEQKRVLNDQKAYDAELARLMKKLKTALVKWEELKAKFDIQAKEEHEEAMQKWLEEKDDLLAEYKKKRSKYKKEKKEYDNKKWEDPDCENATFFACKRPVAPLVPLAPKRQQFSEKRPQLVEPKPIVPARTFTKPVSQLIRDPAYHLLPLVLHVTKAGCAGRFRVAVNSKATDIRWVEATPESYKNPSFLANPGRVSRCTLNDLIRKRRLISIEHDQGRLSHLSYQGQALAVHRIQSPAVRELEQGMAARVWQVKKLDFSKEPIEAVYRLQKGRASMFVSYEHKKPNVTKTTTTLPDRLLDPNVKDPVLQTTRVELFQKSMLGDRTLPLIRRLYAHPPKDSPKNWTLLANIGHTLVNKKILYKIVLDTRVGGVPDRREINNAGKLVANFTSLLYMASRMAAQKDSWELAYLQGATVLQGEWRPIRPAVLKNRGRTLNIQGFELTVDGGKRATYHVGVGDEILYRVDLHHLNDALVLKDITSPTILKNRAWKKTLIQQHYLEKLRR